MDKFDERQEYERGKIMSRAFILTIGLLLILAFINEFDIFDVEKKIGFGDTLLILACINITYVSVEAILNGSYFAPKSNHRFCNIAYLFTFLTLVLVILSVLDIVKGEHLTALHIVSLVMVLSITISMWIRKTDWRG